MLEEATEEEDATKGAAGSALIPPLGRCDLTTLVGPDLRENPPGQFNMNTHGTCRIGPVIFHGKNYIKLYVTRLVR